MNFYDRTNELTLLETMRTRSFETHSQLTVLTGRRRIGKTSLIFKSCEGTPTLYLFVSRSNEAELCSRFAGEAERSLGEHMPEFRRFGDMFLYLMELGGRLRYNLVIDEFQEFYYINSEVYGRIQDGWDRLRRSSNLNLIVSGSVNTLMNKIFVDAREPLFGRADRLIRLQPFTPSVLKQIMADCRPGYSGDDLLALYTFTGGVPKYVEQFIDEGCDDMESMVDFMLQPGSVFIGEGQALLIQEFGRKYGNYFSILSAISNGRNTLPAIEQTLGGTSAGGQLKRLEEDYGLIKKKRPLLSKVNSQNLRYEICDMFLRFWFRYFIKYAGYVEAGNNRGLSEVIKSDYPTFSGLALEEYFRQKLIEEGGFEAIGSWWQRKAGADQNEIDLVAIYAGQKRALAAEIKRQGKNFKPELLQRKIAALNSAELNGFEIEGKLLTMNDM